MNTDTLIDRLATDVRPVPRGALRRRLALGITAGGAVSLAAVLLLLGMRPDLSRAIDGVSFWMKWAYTISIAICATTMLVRLARPDGGGLRGLWLVTIPFGLLAVIGVVEMAHFPPGDWLSMWLGNSWRVCSSLVLLLSIPIFIGLVWSFRRLAPTRLRAAGAAAGLSAGAFAATVYCVHCPEVSAIFVLTWYTLGILLSAALGALLGPRLFRW